MPHDRKQALETLFGRGQLLRPAALPGLMTTFAAEGHRSGRDFSSTSATFSLKERFATEPNMSKESAYFLVPASGGLCIQPQNNGIYTANIEGKEGQQCIVERDEGDRIAFRNAAGKQYLRAKGGHNSAQVVLGSRQWWKLEGSKEQAIRDEFGFSPTRYYQLLNGLVDRPEAQAFDPLTVKRVRRLRADRRRQRTARDLGIRL